MKTNHIQALRSRAAQACLACLSCLVFLWPAGASAATYGLHLGSRHDAPGFDDANVGVYAILDKGLTLGTFNNSESRQSFYVGKTWHHPLAPHLGADLTLGAITGYDWAVSPMVVPSLAVELTPGLRLRGAVLFKIYKTGANAIHLMIEKDFR